MKICNQPSPVAWKRNADCPLILLLISRGILFSAKSHRESKFIDCYLLSKINSLLTLNFLGESHEKGFTQDAGAKAFEVVSCALETFS